MYTTTRRPQYILPPKSVAFTGAVGDDSLAEQLRKADEREGVLHEYDVHEGEKTGACAVVITGHHRFVPVQVRCPIVED